MRRPQAIERGLRRERTCNDEIARRVLGYEQSLLGLEVSSQLSTT